MENKDNILTIVVPSYNEEEILEDSYKTLNDILKKMISEKKISSESRILFVDDGSKDKTWSIVSNLENNDNNVFGIKLSRNYGHQNALIAGMSSAQKYSDMIISIDADLQDDPNAIIKMVDLYYQGNQIVLGVRNDRKTDTFFKKTTANLFYKTMHVLGVSLTANSADFRLMSSKAVGYLLEFSERNLFLRATVPLIGLKTATVEYKRTPRAKGESKYPLKKMISFALDGITSFSIKPIRILFGAGVLVVILSIFMLLYSIFVKQSGESLQGWSSLMVSIWFLGGIQLISISLIGEYIGKIFSETKRRPLYFIETNTLENKKD